jgi:hypothetical protein
VIRTLNDCAAVVGWIVFLMWLLGAVGLGDFVLSFEPKKDAAAAVSVTTKGAKP